MAKLKLYYNNTSDYQNTNRFYDKLEGLSNEPYNSFLSTSSVDLCYKVNDREQILNFKMPDFISLSCNGMRLVPSSFKVQELKVGQIVVQPSDNTPITQPTNNNLNSLRSTSTIASGGDTPAY